MFIDAAVILGTDADEQAISVYFDEVLDKSKGKLNSRGKKDNSLRNFIARNVIESDRFRYLTRYSNPQNVRMLAQNHTVVEFVLGELPDKQIDRYCQACGIRTAGDRKARVRALTDIITDMNFKQFEDVRQQAKSREENMMKQKLQSLISLYLTVLYILTKNLVNVNSRYFLAFHCLERDSELLKITAGAYGRPYSAITADFIERNQLNSHARRYMQTNIENSDEWAIACYRDHAAHLGAVRNAHAYIDGVKSIRSYFELYHYVTQRAISDRYDYEAGNGTLPDGINPATLRYFALVKENGWYCKDFVKALNVAFGYNLPRYKNLTIDGLFDKDRPFEISEDEKF
jgi:hypothetical protein